MLLQPPAAPGFCQALVPRDLTATDSPTERKGGRFVDGGWRVACDRPDICRSGRSPGMTRPFQFGVVAPLATDLPTWRALVRVPGSLKSALPWFRRPEHERITIPLCNLRRAVGGGISAPRPEA